MKLAINSRKLALWSCKQICAIIYGRAVAVTNTPAIPLKFHTIVWLSSTVCKDEKDFEIVSVKLKRNMWVLRLWTSITLLSNMHFQLQSSLVRQSKAFEDSKFERFSIPHSPRKCYCFQWQWWFCDSMENGIVLLISLLLYLLIFVLNTYNITILFSLFLVLEILYTQALENVIRESEVSEM